ncbi:hypothetical protein GS504_03210 [Rhodococcus hoagii]|nr:hypothetical protein [Prescottella equi]
MRVDPTCTHTYASTVSMPDEAPDFPWAIHLADRSGRYRLLAFDFDSGRHGADVARADADRMCVHLSELGVAHLRTLSGPAGGQHVWVRLSERGAAAADVRELADALRAHYPSLDTAPLSNPVTGAVRPPGAPHRHSGHSLPHLQHQALDDALARMARGTTPEIVGWLLSRHPHVAATTRDTRSRTIRVIDDESGLRLDRPRRQLSDHTRELLNTTPSPGADRSAIAHSILLGMAHAGWTLADAEAAVESPGLIRLRQDRNRGRDDLGRQWQRAVESAAQFAPAALADRAPIDGELDRVEAAVTADPTRWARPGGASDERILHALIALARTARTRTLDIDVRRLAEAAAVDASTVSRRLRVLQGEGWVTRVHEGAGTRAATWELNLSEDIVDATQGFPPPGSTALLDHHGHDVWVHRHGLGGVAARIHWAVLNFGEMMFSVSLRSHLVSLASATGYTVATIRRVLNQLRTLGLLPSRKRTPRMTRVAKILGSAGTAARRAARHLVDRELHRWWTEETEWRARRGPKRGVRGNPTGTIALPIAAPARARYGRFPTTGGRADYSTARQLVERALALVSDCATAS